MKGFQSETILVAPPSAEGDGFDQNGGTGDERSVSNKDFSMRQNQQQLAFNRMQHPP